MSVSKRVYVGNVIQDHEASLRELRPRFERFGRCLSSEFESHGHFAYMNMEFNDEAGYSKLKQSLNGVRFKGNVLKVDQAKLSWQQRWDDDQKNEERVGIEREKQLLKQQWEYHKKIENIKMSWIDRQQILHGRMRQNPRAKAQLRNITFRVLSDGQLKVYKCSKNKLWGYEREKMPRDLVARFTDQRHWRDGNNHIVDKLDYSRASSWSKHHGIGSAQETDTGLLATAEDIEESSDQKTKDVLENLLGDFDFDKPMAIQEDEDENASSDYEYNALYQEPTDVMKATGKEKKQEVPKPVEEVKELHVSEPEKPEEDSEDDFVPTFGNQPVLSTKSNTEELRSLFNPEESKEATFKLMDETNEDIDETKNVLETENAQELSTEDSYVGTQNTNRGLFFPHFTSPFLQSQSQLAKLKSSQDHQELFANWEDKFWENRATWTKEMKQKKRDADRQNRKKNSKSRGNGILV
ncbi:LANO_0F00452g1_1 [Lachancea nothofagi CBS 11611]|uniref:LANO_0F00452g1_1 n=1 Tax=Lachancea nothofagi CBS 11611 TaxID=1266666 RepID=A0A1G4K5F2_9SACH|nr:LANO_0F00452g1_1 [Lachancea nothofagi CBS 11611]